MFNENNYDVVFMDINMPIKDGYETSLGMKELKKHSLIVAVSGYDGES